MDHTLRVYSNPFKQSFYLLGSLGFVAVGLLMLSDPKVRTDTPLTVVAYLTVGFCGLGAVIFLYSLGRDLLLRRPLLQVDAQGWTYDPALRRQPRHFLWQDVGRVALYCQRIPTRFSSSRTYYLVLEARHPDQLRPSRLQPLIDRLYPSVSLALMGIPLNAAFMRTTPERVERLLQRIQAEFSDEIHRYDITVSDTIQDM